MPQPPLVGVCRLGGAAAASLVQPLLPPPTAFCAATAPLLNPSPLLQIPIMATPPATALAKLQGLVQQLHTRVGSDDPEASKSLNSQVLQLIDSCFERQEDPQQWR